ncbi:TPM domain-containing protein, partial [Agromyces binzhouensis]
MADAADWLPSLVVFGTAALAFVAGVIGFRRLGARREAHDAAAARELETSAKARLVGADEAVRDAVQEIRFAEAQFGPEAARGLGETVDRARGWLREAFLLQQRIDDAGRATAAERRTWSSRIASLCDSVERALADA